MAYIFHTAIQGWISDHVAFCSLVLLFCMKFSIMEARTTKRSSQVPLWNAIIIFKQKLAAHQNASVLHCISIAGNTWKKKWKILIDSLPWPLLLKIIKRTLSCLLSNLFLSFQKPTLCSNVNFWYLLCLPFCTLLGWMKWQDYDTREDKQFTVVYSRHKCQALIFKQL